GTQLRIRHRDPRRTLLRQGKTARQWRPLGSRDRLGAGPRGALSMSYRAIEQGAAPTPTLPRLRGRGLIRAAVSKTLPRKRGREARVARGWGLGARRIGQ